MKQSFRLEELIEFFGPLVERSIESMAFQRELQNILFDVVRNSKASGMHKHVATTVGSPEEIRFSPWSRYVYFENLSFLYCQIPKNATNSIFLHALRASEPNLYVALRRLGRWNPPFLLGVLDALQRMHTVTTLGILDRSDIRRVAFLRDPYLRFVSAVDDKLLKHFAGVDSGTIEVSLTRKMASVYNTLSGVDLGIEDWTLNIAIDYVLKTDPCHIDMHFAPQCSLVFPAEKLELYKLSSMKPVLNRFFGFRDGLPLAKLNEARPVWSMSDEKRHVGLHDLLSLPFGQWQQEHFSAWNRLKYREFIEYISTPLRNFFQCDAELFSSARNC